MGRATEQRWGYGRSVGCSEVFNHRFTCMYCTVYYQRYYLLTVYVSKFITVMSKNVTSCAMHTVYKVVKKLSWQNYYKIITFIKSQCKILLEGCQRKHLMHTRMNKAKNKAQNYLIRLAEQRASWPVVHIVLSSGPSACRLLVRP